MIHLRQFMAFALSAFLCVPPVGAQQATSIDPIKPQGDFFVRPYQAQELPPVRLSNSTRLGNLIKAGQLYLSLDDAIALALENNIDLEIARYSPISAALRVTRSEAGGALPGVPSSASQAGSVASGQGVLGSQSAAGVSGGGGNGSISRGGGNASISQLGPVTQNLDPIVQYTATFGHRTVPQANDVQSRTTALVQDTRNSTLNIQQGMLTGGTLSFGFRSNYLNENSPTNILNPSTATSFSLNLQHNLLQGFGRAVNSRTITVSRINLKTSPLTFKTQVISVVNNVVSAYISLVAATDDVRAKQSALETAETFFKDSTRRVDVGSLAGVDLIAAEREAASARRDLIISQTTQSQTELRLKNLLSRDGIANPAFAAARIIPTDRLTIPDRDDLPTQEALVAQAMANRADLALRKSSIETTKISSLGTTSALLPRVVGFVGTSQQGLAGTARTVAGNTADPYFVGGLGTALGQSLRRNFPSENGGAFMQATIRNRAASADQAIDELQLRQSELGIQKDLNQVQVDIMNAVVAIQQARVRFEASAKNRELADLLLEAEKKKFALGASTPFNVLQQQRGLTVAQAAETSALVGYRNARIALDLAIGATLESNHVAIEEAVAGRSSRP
ncbi:MAG: TolC family protein [Acidobacteria bacterium]|nr:TolC family protein [Acidobacteriota bacterium]